MSVIKSVINIISLENPLLDIMNCDLTMVNFSFQHLQKKNYGPTILNAITSQVKIYGMKCSGNNASNGLLQIQNNSYLHLENSEFINNGHITYTTAIISVQLDSSILVSHCTFSNNSGSFGSCCFCKTNTHLDVILSPMQL